MTPVTGSLSATPARVGVKVENLSQVSQPVTSAGQGDLPCTAMVGVVGQRRTGAARNLGGVHSTPATIRGQTLWPARQTLDLASVLLTDPALPDAACRGHHELFDRATIGDADAQREALTMCGHCAERTRCHDWSQTLTDRERRALGVVGGGIYVRAKSPDIVARHSRQLGQALVRPEGKRETARNRASVSAGATKPARVVPDHGRRHREAQRARIEAQRAARRAARSAASKQAS